MARVWKWSIWLLAAFVIVSAGATSQAASGALVWSHPVTVDRLSPRASGVDIGATCPFKDLRFAVDDFGNLLSTRDPESSAPWRVVHFDLPPVTGLSLPACPSENLCLIGAKSHLLVSTNPTGGRSAWHRTASFDPHSIWSIRCPGRRLCLLKTHSGPIFVSTDPTGGSASWRQLPPGPGQAQYISRPTTRFCALSGVAGNLFTSSDPGGGAGAWSKQKLPIRLFLNDLECPSARLCVALDGAGNLLSTTTPATGPWSSEAGNPINPSGLGDLYCPGTSLCFMNDSWDGHLWASADPTGGASAWHETPAFGDLVTPACPSTSFCLATVQSGWDDPSASYEGALYSTSDPVNGPWTRGQRIDGYNPLTALSCTADGVCAAIDTVGNALSTADPSGGPRAWRGVNVDSVDHLDAVSCASRKLCVATDQNGGVSASSDPADPGASWARAEIDPGRSLSDIACPSASLCLAVDGSSTAFDSTHPADGAGAWDRLLIPGVATAVACPSATRCIVGSDGAVFTSTHPTTGGPASWKRTRISGSGGLAITSLACPSRRLCVAADSRGDLLASPRPWGRTPAWRTQIVGHDNSHSKRFVKVTCASAHLCLAIAHAKFCHEGECEGYVITDASTDPTGGLKKWSPTDTSGLAPVGVDCVPQSTNCVAIDALGRISSSR